MSNTDSTINAAPQSSHSGEGENLKEKIGWETVIFTQVYDIQGGTQPPKSEFVYEPTDGYVRLLQIRDFGKKPVPTFVLKSKKLKTCKKQDLLIGRYGASLGRICTGMEGAYNVALAKVITPTDVSGGYTRRYLESHLFQDPLNLLSRSAQNGFNKDDLASFYVPLPPLAEQKVIADKLDELLAQVDTLKARLDAIPAILKRFRQSVLAAAVSGKLTEEWRLENPNLSSGTEVLTRWLQVRQKSFAEDQASRIQKGLQKRPKQFKEPTPPDLEKGIESPPESWATVSVSQFAECLDHVRVPVTKADRNSAKGLYPYFGANGEVDRVDEYLFDDELVLVTEDETFYGRVKPIAYRFSGKCWVNNHAHVLRAPTKDANDFLCYALMYYNVIPWLSGTTGRAKLTQGALNSLPVFLPPEEEQAEIVRKVEQLFTYADQVEQQVKNAQACVNQLTQSILAKAFRGELTEQWRQDNPELISGENSAAALLERIKAERAAATPAKKKAPARKAKA